MFGRLGLDLGISSCLYLLYIFCINFTICMLDVNHFPHVDWKDLGGEASSYIAGVFSAFIDRRHAAQLLLCFHLDALKELGR